MAHAGQFWPAWSPQWGQTLGTRRGLRIRFPTPSPCKLFAPRASCRSGDRKSTDKTTAGFEEPRGRRSKTKKGRRGVSGAPGNGLGLHRQQTPRAAASCAPACGRGRTASAFSRGTLLGRASRSARAASSRERCPSRCIFFFSALEGPGQTLFIANEKLASALSCRVGRAPSGGRRPGDAVKKRGDDRVSLGRSGRVGVR